MSTGNKRPQHRVGGRFITRAEWIALQALYVILGGVGVMALFASTSHVKGWTMANSPDGTNEFFGWTNAAISDLVPVACFILYRLRRKAGQSYGWVLAAMFAAMALSLTAQLAVARPSISGWIVSAVPMLAFAALAKLVLSTMLPERVNSKPKEQPRYVDSQPIEAKADTEPAPENVVPIKTSEAKRVRKSKEERLEELRLILKQEPDIKQAEIAARMGFKDPRQVRNLLAELRQTA